jgi:CHAT domain-containing protein
LRVADLKVGLLLYFVDTEYVHVVVLDQEGRSRRINLTPWDTALPLIDRLLGAMQRSYVPTENQAIFEEFAYEWGHQLLPPAEHLQSFDILVVVPHYALHGLPLHAIWLPDRQQFLATAFGVTYCSSGTLFARCVDRNVVRRFDLSRWEFSLEGVATGAPVPPQRCVSVGVDVLGEQNEQYLRVAKTFADPFQDPFVGASRLSSRLYFKNRLFGADPWEVICLVCHGYYDTVMSANSGLLLETRRGIYRERTIPLYRGTRYDFRDLPFTHPPAAVEPRREAELMTVGELKVDCHTDAQLIALFGCETATGHLLSGDDFESMAYQWLKIGAASVLANLWELDVDYITNWSPIFLDNWLRKRQPKAIAYRQATAELLRRDTSVKLYDWATIALMGDWL